MANYLIELGFDWNATQIGDSDYKPLQIGLVNQTDSNSPAFYQFNDGDIINFHIYNIGSATDKTAISFTLGLKDPDSEEMLNIFNLPAGQWSLIDAGTAQRSYAFSYSGGPTDYPAWFVSYLPDSGSGITGYEVTVYSNTKCELGAEVVVQDDNDDDNTITFVVDPEMWIDA